MASWLTSRLKAAEQFLNQIDATAADRALKKKEQDQGGQDSDSEAGASGVGHLFPRTASQLSFTDEITPSGRTSGDEIPEAAPRFTRHSSLSRPKGRTSQAEETPPVADWTELLKGGGDKIGVGSGLKILKTAGSLVTGSVRAPRILKQGGGFHTGAVPPAKKEEKGREASTLMSAASSTGSATAAPEKSGEPEVVSKREEVAIRPGIEEPSTSLHGTAPHLANGKGSTEREANGLDEFRARQEEGANGSSGRPGEALNGADSEMKGQTESLSGIPPAEGVNAPEADPARGVRSSRSGVEAVIPTSDSEEASAIVGGVTSSGDEKEALASRESTPQIGPANVGEEPVFEPASSLEKSDEAAAGFEETDKANPLSVESAHGLADGEKTSTTGEPDPPAMPAADSGSPPGVVPQGDDSLPKNPERNVDPTRVGSERRDFSMREYMGQDLSVKEVETEGMDSDADSGSGTDEETDSDTDDSEDERAAEEQRQKEEAERVVLERQRAAAAAAALEATAAETATQAVKERQDVVALLEKEREELQVEAAEASEQHAREIARLRATATAGSEAAHVEKSSHSSTRMETYSKEERLVMENVDKAKALAAAQRALEGVVAKTLEARRKVEERELYRAGLRKQVSEAQHQLRALREGSEAEAATSSHAESSLNAELERWEADVRKEKQRVAELEARLSAAAGQKREPSERERELERRLQSLTDHLIQKQAQVEALASEKATLALRLETVSSSLHDDEQGDGPFRKRGKGGRTMGTEWWMDDDLEYGHDEPSRGGKSGRGFGFDQDDSSDDDGKKHKGGIVPGFVVTALQRFDGLALGGGRLLRANTPGRVLLGLYILLLHAWVLLVWSIQSSYEVEEGSPVVFGSKLPGAT